MQDYVSKKVIHTQDLCRLYNQFAFFFGHIKLGDTGTSFLIVKQDAMFDGHIYNIC